MESVALEPKKILTAIGLQRDAVVADFGCGPGVFTLPAASLTTGTVHAIDIRASVLDVCVHEASHQKLTNISPEQLNLERKRGSELDDKSVDFVIMRKIISQNKKKGLLFEEAFRVLKEKGKLLVIGWNDDAVVGPLADTRVTQKDMRGLAAKAGFEEPEEIILNHQHYGLAFIK